MSSRQPQTWKQWARLVERDPDSPSGLRKGSLAALTGTDVRVLDAFVPCMQLYIHTEDRALLSTAGLLLQYMQPKNRWIARELLPFVREWSDRELLWPLIVPVRERAS